MKYNNPFELDDIKKFAKDAEAHARLEDAFKSQASEIATLKHQLDLLESAIRNDYDSIIITELSLEKPGPKIVYVNDGFTRMTGYTKQEVLGGFTLIGPLDLENNEIFGVDDPSTDKSEVNKQYFDQRGDFYNNVTFHSGVFCHELDSSTSQESSVVNKESLETGGWVGLRSLKTTLQKKFAPMFDTEVCAAFVKGNVASYTTVCKDSSLVNTVALTK